MIKVIFFDLGGVLFTNGTKKFINDISQQYNLNPKDVSDLMDGELGSKYREAKITRDEFWKVVLEKLQIKSNSDELEAQWINGYELISGTREIILELSNKYNVYYLSDNAKERVERINERFHFLDWFTDGIFSYEVGVRKPHPENYQYALTKAGVTAEEAVFIDDKEIFLGPAKDMGITTILFENPEQLRQKLVELNVL